MNKIKRPDGVELELPNINSVNVTNCSHTFSIDGFALDHNTAIRYLLADRERILTLLGDARSELDKIKRKMS